MRSRNEFLYLDQPIFESVESIERDEKSPRLDFRKRLSGKRNHPGNDFTKGISVSSIIYPIENATGNPAWRIFRAP